MYRYTAYGLGIESTLALPELVDQETRLDVSIRNGPVDSARPANAEGTDWLWATHDEACLIFDDIATYLIRGGREIIIDPAPNAEVAAIRLMLLGSCLGVLLHQRGFLLLHASCIALDDDAAVAFLANKGMGKSTLAGEFVKRGFRLISDDVVAIDPDAEPLPLVYPAFPQLKLWPNSVRQMGQDPRWLPRVTSEISRRSHRVVEKFATRPLPLRAVYSLTNSRQPQQWIEPLSGQAAMMELVAHSYVLGLLKFTGTMTRHFKQTVAVTRKAPVRRLHRRRELAALDELTRLVENDVATCTS